MKITDGCPIYIIDHNTYNFLNISNYLRQCLVHFNQSESLFKIKNLNPSNPNVIGFSKYNFERN